MTIDTAVETKLPTQSTPAPEVEVPKYSGELRKRYEKVQPYVRRALYNVTDPKERRIKRNAAFVAADSYRQEVEPILERNKVDPLTKLNTLQTFEEILDVQCKLAKSQGKKLTLLFADLDGFKKINDTLGHDVGNIVLTQIGEVIGGSIRPTDVAGRVPEKKQDEELVNGDAARFGGDEFVILLQDAGEIGAQKVVARIKEEMDHIPYQDTLKKADLKLGVSVGIRDVDLDNPKQTLVEADAAMYQEKNMKKIKLIV